MPTAFAFKIKDLDGFTGKAALYQMVPEYEGNSYVVVSKTSVLNAPETYMFPGNIHGEVTSWGELEGSRRGIWTHKEILEGIGYTVA